MFLRLIMSIYFSTITPENWRIFNALKVKDEQKAFVASNIAILAKAFTYRDYNSRVHAIYNDSLYICTKLKLVTKW